METLRGIADTFAKYLAANRMPILSSPAMQINVGLRHTTNHFRSGEQLAKRFLVERGFPRQFKHKHTAKSRTLRLIRSKIVAARYKPE